MWRPWLTIHFLAPTVQAKGEADEHTHTSKTNTLSEMSTRMQKVLSSCSDGQTLHRSHSRVQDCLHIGATMHRLRYLPKEMSFWCHPHHQPADKPRDSSHPPLLGKQFQVAQTTHATPRPGPGSGGNKRYRQEYSFEDSQRQIEAQFGSIRQPSGLGGDPEILPWFRVAESVYLVVLSVLY